MTNEPTLALISDGTFFIDGESRPGLITVQRFEGDRIEISVQPLTQLPYSMHLEVILDTVDLSYIRHLLKAQDLADVIRPSESAADYDCRTTQDHLESLERAVTSLHQHQVLDARRVEKLETEQRVASRTVNATFNEIERRLSEIESQR